MTTQTLQLGWKRLPSPSVTGLAALGQSAGSLRGPAFGVQQLADGMGVVVWAAGQAQYYDAYTGAWSPALSLRDPLSAPGSWAPLYKGGLLYFDITSRMLTKIDVATGNNFDVFKQAFGQLRFQLYPSGPSYATSATTPSFWWDSDLPGTVTIPIRSTLTTRSALMLIDYQSPTLPRVKALFDTGATGGDLLNEATGAFERTQTSSGAGSNSGMLGNRIMSKVIGFPPNPALPYARLSHIWTVFRTVLPGSWAAWFAAGAYSGWQTYPQSAGDIDYIYTNTNFEATLLGLNNVGGLVVQGRNCYVQALRTLGILSSVVWVPYDLATSTFGPLPIALPPPAGLNTQGYCLFAIDGIPHILDSNNAFYSLALASWDNQRHRLYNWTRVVY